MENEKEQYIIFLEAYIEKLKAGRLTSSQEEIEELETAVAKIKELMREYKQAVEDEKKKAEQQIINNEFHSIGYENICYNNNEINFQNNSDGANIIFNQTNKTIMKVNWDYEEDAEPITLQELKAIQHQIEILRWEE